jgi:hypothetical protein
MTTLTVSVYMNTGWVNLTSQVLNCTIDQPFDRVNDVFLAGTTNFVFTDENGDWNPDNSGSPYYGYIVPMVPIKIVSNHASVDYPLYYGYVDSWKYRPANGADVAMMTVRGIDGIGRLAQATLTTLTSYSAINLTGFRIQGVYDTMTAAGWTPSSYTEIGQTYMGADAGTYRTALDVINQAVETELGIYYQDNLGVLTFYDRSSQWQLAAITPYYFYDNGNPITYQDTAFKYDTDFLYNDVIVQGVEVYNPSSVVAYGKRTLSRNNVFCQNYDDAYNQALTLAVGRSVPILRTDYITLDITPGQPSDRIEAGLNIYFYNPLVVTRTVPGGSTISKNLVCCSLKYSFTPQKWSVTIGTFEPDLAGFVLDSTTMGILNTNQLVY